MPSKYRKPRSIKQKKSILKNRFFWFGISTALMLVVVMYGFLFSGVFQIENIEITGAQKVSDQILKSMAEESLKGNILGISMNHIMLADTDIIKENMLERFPEIRDIGVQRKFFHTIAFNIKERRGIALMCREEGQCFALDTDGVLFEEREKSEFLPVFRYSQKREVKIGEEIIPVELLQRILEFYEEFREYAIFKETETRFSVLEIHSNRRIIAKHSGGWEAYIDPLEDIHWQAEKLKAVFSKNISEEQRSLLEYIDLRYGDQAFVKYRE